MINAVAISLRYEITYTGVIVGVAKGELFKLLNNGLLRYVCNYLNPSMEGGYLSAKKANV